MRQSTAAKAAFLCVHKRAGIGILLCILSLVLILPTPVFCAPKHDAEYDVVVAGAGMGGIAAAVQAARMGASVLIVEESDWIGGQATAAGVSTMDDLSRLRSGIYLEFVSRMKIYYDLKGKSMGTCYWDPRTIAFEPFVGQRILYEMLEDAREKSKRPLDILLQTSITEVAQSGDSVTGVSVREKSGVRKIGSRVLIDATEYGDILPLAGVNYRSGNSLSPFIDDGAMIQDITWTAVIRQYPRGIPPHLKVPFPLPGYEQAKRNYESYVAADGMDFKGIYPVQLPVNFVSHNAYRGIPDSGTPWNYDGRPSNWKYITKCGVNWGNDYPGKASWNGRKGLPVQYLEDKTFRDRIEKDAFIKTLHFIYYIQTELGENWSVADDEYNHADLPPAAEGLPREWHEIARRMPPIPYVRESRRALGEHTLTSAELLRNSLSYRDGQTSHEFHDAIAIGGYILDLHGADTDSDMEWQLEEKARSIQVNRPRGPFQVPLRILIPQNKEGFLVAEKNLSMSRLAAGALRLQPICMMVGQAAGALAALSIENGIALRELPAVQVQRVLLDAGVVLSLCKYSDVPPEHPFYNSVQLSNLYALLDPIEPPHAPSYNISDLDDPVLAMAIIRGADKGFFGVDEMLRQDEMLGMLRKARDAAKSKTGRIPDISPKEDSFVSRGLFAQAICETFGFEKGETSRQFFSIPDGHRYADAVRTMEALDLLDLFKMEREIHPARPLTRGEAVEILTKAMTAVDLKAN